MTRPPVMPTDDYETIEAAVMDTARGRWFLAEFARRNRTADTSILLEAIERLEKRLVEVEANAPPKPHEPADESERHTSAASELFAVEPPAQYAAPAVSPDFMLSSLPDDVAWLGGEDDDARTPAEFVEINDEQLVLPPPSVQSVAPPDPEPQAESARIRPASPQTSMLATALAQAEQNLAAVPDAPQTAPASNVGTPPPADPAELDALSFEEKSVYFA